MNMSTAPEILAHRRFSPADQEAFANLSGDRNPIHMDEIAARRTQAGAPIVHGVHLMLWAMDSFAKSHDLDGVTEIAARFARFVHVGAVVELRLTPCPGGVTLNLAAGGQDVARMKLMCGEAKATEFVVGTGEPSGFGSVADAPLLADMASLEGLSIQSGADSLAPLMFPNLSEVMGDSTVAAVAATSGVVGMKCPGLHSIFVELKLSRSDTGPCADGLAWRVLKTDLRLGWITVGFGLRGWKGEAFCLKRAEPAQGRPMRDLISLVDPAEFNGRRAFIVGGSRGMGATTAKLLAAGGADVVLTYARGRTDAAAIRDEIRSIRGDALCEIHPLDIRADVGSQLAPVSAKITHLYYFAAPLIGRQKSQVYDPTLFAEFTAVFVDGFAALWDGLSKADLKSAFYPSTTFLDDRPKGMTEYIMAKAAAEALCMDLSRARRDIGLSVPRLPRVLTDQTATWPPVPTEDPVDVLLPLLRAEKS